MIIETLKRYIWPNSEAIHLCRKLVQYRNNNRKILELITNKKLITNYGIHLGKNAKIGKNLIFPHPLTIVIGDEVVIGDNCIIYHNVTIGKSNRNKKFSEEQYPVIGNNVTVFTGATLLGGITVGDNVVIGAHSIVNTNLESNAVYAGMPAKKIRSL